MDESNSLRGKRIGIMLGSLRRGGTENTMVTLADELARRGAAVRLMLLGSGIDLKPDRRVKVILLGSSPAQRLARLGAALRRERFDTVAVCFPKEVLYLRLASLRKSCRLVCFERSNPFMTNAGRSWSLMRHLTSRLSDGMVFQTEGSSKFYSKAVRRRSAVIPNGLIGGVADHPVMPLDRRTPGKLVSVGSLYESKGHDTVIRAFDIFSRTRQGFTLHIYGEGDHRPALEELIGELGLEGKVILEGKTDDVAGCISDGEIFLFGSRHEGMPNALMEAMACGLACVSTDCDFGPRELIRDGENGILVPVDDAEAMARRLGQLADDRALRERLSLAGARIRDTNSWANIAGRYIEFLLGDS